MRITLASMALGTLVTITGCVGRPSATAPPPAPTDTAPAETPAEAPTAAAPAEAPTAAAPVEAPADAVSTPPATPYLYPDSLPTPDGGCEQTILSQVQTPGKWELSRDREWCLGDWKDSTTGYGIQGSLLKITAAQNRWPVYKAYPYATDPKSISLHAENGSYPGVILPLFMEKTGAAFWGPTPLEAVFVTERGAFHLICSPNTFAHDAAEGKAAAQQLAEVCPSLLGRVQLGDLGKPVEPDLTPIGADTAHAKGP